MKKVVLIVLIVVLAIIVSLITGFYLYTRQMKNESYSSEYEYRINVDIDGNTMTDMILYVPYPTVDGQAVDKDILQGSNYIPDNWNLSYIETDYGPMLKVHLTNVSSREGVTLNIDAEGTIDTKEPINNEPLLYPKLDLHKADCDYPYPESWEERVNCYRYTGIIYMESNYTDPIHISLEIRGENTWWVFGWNGNEYIDMVYVEITETQGWIETQGSMRTGMGNY